jgi:hypothetical protein
MRRGLVVGFAVATGSFCLCEAALGCGLGLKLPWICEGPPIEYAPMRVPLQDPRPGPVWTSNGWVYPDPQLYAAAQVPPPYALPMPPDARESGKFRPERPLK